MDVEPDGLVGFTSVPVLEAGGGLSERVEKIYFKKEPQGIDKRLKLLLKWMVKSGKKW